MRREERNQIIATISRETRLPMDVVEKVITHYRELIGNKTTVVSKARSPIMTGIMALDSLIELHPGITLIHGYDSSGKTSILKTMALSSSVAEMNTLYHDTECKLYPGQLKEMANILFCNTSEITPIKDWLHSRLLDIAMIDSFTGLLGHSQQLLYHQLRKSVPYVVGSTQMRHDIKTNTTVPACSDSLLSTSKTRISITSSEKVKWKSVDMKRIYLYISKYPNRETIGERTYTIIKNDYVCNFHYALDILRNRGIMKNTSRVTLLRGEEIADSYEELLMNPEVYPTILYEASKEMGLSNEYTERYINMHELLYNISK